MEKSLGSLAAQPDHMVAEPVAGSSGTFPDPSRDVGVASSAESLEVLAVFASCDCLLTWPIFAERWPAALLSRELLIGSFESTHSDTTTSGLPTRQYPGPGVREEDVPQLVDQFLEFVHPKNPILYIWQIREHARRIAEDRFGWDATSCIVVSIYPRRTHPDVVH